MENATAKLMKRGSKQLSIPLKTKMVTNHHVMLILHKKYKDDSFKLSWENIKLLNMVHLHCDGLRSI